MIYEKVKVVTEWVVLTLLITSIYGCCSQFNNIKEGAARSQVINELGPASEVVFVDKTSPSVYKDTDVMPKCPCELLVYKCGVSEAVFIYVDSSSHVVKIKRLTYAERTAE